LGTSSRTLFSLERKLQFPQKRERIETGLDRKTSKPVLQGGKLEYLQRVGD
jgi:hypothetical protein